MKKSKKTNPSPVKPALSSKEQELQFLNSTSVIYGEFEILRDEDTAVTIYLRNPQFFNPQTQQVLPLSDSLKNPDKFQVTAEDLQLAKSEFFARWKRYIAKKFNRYIPLEIRSTTFLTDDRRTAAMTS
jgi:hypothetical protein